MPFVTIARSVAPSTSGESMSLFVSSADEVLEYGFTSGLGTHMRVLDEDGDVITPDFAPGSVYITSPTLLADGDVLAIKNNLVTRFDQAGNITDQSTFQPGAGRLTELADGNILATFNDGNGNLQGQLLSPTLDLVGSTFTIAAGSNYISTVTALTGGGFAVLCSVPFALQSIRVFDATGAAVGAPISRASYVYGEIEALPDGGFVFGGSTLSAPANTQIFNADGSARSAAIPVGGTGVPVSVAVLDNDLFLVTHIVSNDTIGQLYHTSGHALGNEFLLSAGTTVDAEGIDSDSFVAFGREHPGDPTELIYWSVDRPNILLGDGTAETFDGLGATDRLMAGFGGNDVYNVDSAGDIVHEWAGEGSDTVNTSVSYQLRADAEVELFQTADDAGTTALNLAGNAFAQTIRGNAGANMLSGNGGGDTLVGLGGNDWYFVSNSADVVQEAVAAGADRVFASVNYVLTAGAEIEMLTTSSNFGTASLNLTGNEFVQAIFGNAGTNQLNGGGGADTLVGFGGDDSYVIVNGHERVVESGGGGTDRVFAAVDYTLSAGASVETLSTDADIGTAAIHLTGNEISQSVRGNAGDNWLTGGGGGDTLIGLGGNDFYFVNDSHDVVTEAGGGGTDRVFASLSYTLGASASVETLSTNLNTGTAAINLTGNTLVQTIFGNAGANQLNGGGGADSLLGLEGNDFYYIVNGHENVFESVGAGADRVFAAVDYQLRAGAEVEVMSTDLNTGTSSIDITGNEFAQTIFGNAGDNILNGGAGKDVLVGNGGEDVFLFSTALNTAPGTAFGSLAATANVDRIDGFAFDDRIGLDHTRFGLTPGGLPPGAFVTGTAAQDADDRIIYDSSTGALMFDADGNGAQAAQLFAYINGPFSLDASFFVVV